ncbi:MAG: hypothetical protein HRU19_29745 [Pseudobacteriovorax sp.]|nr:hypothetical protein [Pseudobacteriovorax sp.]
MYRVFYVVAVLLFLQPQADAAVSVGVSGSNSSSSFGLESNRSTTISASVAVGFLNFLRLGLTHRRSYEKKSGFKSERITEDLVAYTEFQDDTEAITNSFDLTAIIYKGLVSPFVFAGVAHRKYFSEVTIRNTIYRSRTTLPLVPNYGIGLSIRLNRDFSLKLTQTFTPGTKNTVDENGVEQEKKVTDSYSQIGITYQL